jgi:hypothetical protein
MPYKDSEGKLHWILAVDFDGVISQYNGWQGLGSFGPPVDNAKPCMDALKAMGWDIIIFTTRGEDIEAVKDYLHANRIPYDKINENVEGSPSNVNDKKVIADVYLDDRAVRFEGDWVDASAEIIFKSEPWWRTHGEKKAQRKEDCRSA